MDGMEQAKTVEDVRRAARKALSRLSRTFGEWETLISSLKADLSDQQSLTRELRDQIKNRPTDEQVEFLNGKIDDLEKSTKKYKTDRKLAVENRNDWKAESSRLRKDLKEKVKEVSRLEAKTSKEGESSGMEFSAVADAVKAELETEKIFSREQAEQISRLRRDLVELRTERQSLETKLDQLQSSLDKRDRDQDRFDANEKTIHELRGDLGQARDQLAKQEESSEASEANENLVRELHSKLEQARERLAKQEKNSNALEASEKDTQIIRNELELARNQLDKLSEMERALQKADRKADELRKKID